MDFSQMVEFLELLTPEQKARRQLQIRKDIREADDDLAEELLVNKCTLRELDREELDDGFWEELLASEGAAK